MTVTTMDPLETMIGTANGVGLWAGPVGTAAPTNLTTAFATAAPSMPTGFEPGRPLPNSTNGA